MRPLFHTPCVGGPSGGFNIPGDGSSGFETQKQALFFVFFFRDGKRGNMSKQQHADTRRAGEALISKRDKTAKHGLGRDGMDLSILIVFAYLGGNNLGLEAFGVFFDHC